MSAADHDAPVQAKCAIAGWDRAAAVRAHDVLRGLPRATAVDLTALAR
jgi:hypothetical protein